MTDRRKTGLSKQSPLPKDYLKMVGDVFAANFDSGLKALRKLKGVEPYFHAQGDIYLDEVFLAVSLLFKDQIAATTVYASCDFDPKASAPTVEDLLGLCVDAIGSIYGDLLLTKSQAKLEQLADESLSALENVPFEWTPLDVDKKRVYVRIDRANPKLDQMADEWLAKHDPRLKEREAEEHEEMEKLFITGPTAKSKKNDPTRH